MNGTVPRISPEKVRPESPTPRKLLARPKSEILTRQPFGRLGDQDVLGLDVAVDEAELVGLFQPLEHLAGEAASLLDRIAAGIGLGERFQVGARDVFHGEPELASGHSLLVKLDDIGMTQLADDRDLALKAIDGGAGCGRLGHDQLESDHLAGEVVASLINHAHRTAAQLAQAGVIGNRLGQPRGLGTAEHAPPFDLLAGRPGLRAHDRQIRRCHRPTARAPNLAQSGSSRWRRVPCDRHPPDDNPCASSTSTRKTLCPAAIMSPETSRTRSTRLLFTNVPLVLPRSRSSHCGGLISIMK